MYDLRPEHYSCVYILERVGKAVDVIDLAMILDLERPDLEVCWLHPIHQLLAWGFLRRDGRQISLTKTGADLVTHIPF